MTPPTADRPPGGAPLVFERLSVRRMPGFEEGGFTLEDLSSGINVVHGPNASGKTTTGRAIRRLLWPAQERAPGDAEASLAAVLDLGGERWEIDLDRDRVRVRRDGEPSSPPPLPPADSADRYSLALHELLQPQVRGEELAAAVAREAAGGYDVEAARQALGARPGPRTQLKARREYEAALARAREVEDEQQRTAAEAESLARLEAEVAGAREARARLGRLEAALERLRCRERLARAREALAAFPPAMERLTGEEAARRAELLDRLESARTKRQEALAAREEERRRLDAAGLPEGGVPDGVLDELGERRERLARLEQDAAQHERELAEARSRRETARRELGEEADDDRLAELRPGDWRAVLELVRRGDALRAEGLELDALAAWIGDPAPLPEIDRRLERLTEEARVLRGWLREPRRAWGRRAPALVAALVLAAVAATGGLIVHPGVWSLAAVALAVVLWSWADVRREAGRRDFLEDEHRRVVGAEPLPWTREPVERRLEEVEERTGAARAERQRAERQGELDSRRRRLEEAEEALAAERRSLAGGLGLAPGDRDLSPAALAPVVHSLQRWREAQDRVEAGEAALEEAGRRHRRELEAVRSTLVPFHRPEGEEAGETTLASRVTDAASVRGAVEELCRRGDAHREATSSLRRLAGDLQRAEEEMERAAAACRELFERLHLEDGDDAGLTRLLDQREYYRTAAHAVRDAETALRLAEEKLDADDELRTWDRAELEAEREEVAERSGRLEELAAELGRVRGEVERVKRHHDLEDALAEVAAKEEELRAERERDADAVVAWVLADWVRERTRGVQRPAVMARAAALFARISGGAFRLLDPVGDPPTLRAEDSRTGATRDLAELSAGRRLQLLVAVRMGFVEEQERGVRVPLVLDETLANSDDASAAALIESVLELAREGRQVFYFTAQADEVSKWRSALEEADALPWREVDLAAVRRLEEERRAPRRTWRPRRPEIPEPEGLDREAYGEELRVPGLDPREEPGAVHLWHLVEEVDALHGLLAHGIERWGELETLLEDAGVDPFGGGEEGGRLRARATARARCLGVLFRGWRIGRGRPVDRGALAASGAVTDRFLDEVSDLAESVGGDASALLAGLEGGEVKGFRKDKLEELAGFLRDEGYLDERPVAGADELREMAVTRLAAELERGDLAVEAIDELLGRLPDLD